MRKVYYFLETDGEHELYFDEHGDFYLCDGEDVYWISKRRVLKYIEERQGGGREKDREI